MSESPERIWIDRGPRGGWMKRFERMPDSEHEYIRTDLVQSQIDAAVAAEREACAAICDDERHNTNALTSNPPQSAGVIGARHRIRARGDTDALEAVRQDARAEALREAAKTAEHFYEKGQVTKPSDILALIPEKEKDDE